MFWIYIITNLVNGKIYVGQHSGPDLQAYLEFNANRAFLPSCEKHKPLLYRAMKKYGPENFVIVPLFRPTSPDQTNRLERSLIKLLNARDTRVGYNIAEGGHGGGTRFGYKNSEAQNQAVSRAQRGRAKSPETRRRMSEAKIGVPTPWVAAANKTRRSPNPTANALKKRRYRERKKLRALGLVTILPMGNGCLGLKASAETKEKMSAAQTARYQREKLGAITTGRQPEQSSSSGRLHSAG